MTKVNTLSRLYNNVAIHLIDVPPLEDCSAFFTIPPASARDPASTTEARVEKPTSALQTQIEDKKSFGGMKKGFLNKGKTSRKKVADDIPFIKPSNPTSTSNLQIPEVQEALKTPLLSSNG